MLGSPPAHSLLPASAAASPFPCSAGCQQQVKPQEFPSSGHLSISATFPSSSPLPSSFTSGLPGREMQAGGLAGRPVTFLKLERLSRAEVGKHLCRQLAKCHGKCKPGKPLLSPSPAHRCHQAALSMGSRGEGAEVQLDPCCPDRNGPETGVSHPAFGDLRSRFATAQIAVVCDMDLTVPAS